MRRWSLLCCFVLSLAGCISFGTVNVNGPKIDKTPIRATPEVVAARLHPVAALPEAACELASLLGVDQDEVRVRLQPKSCITCKLNKVEEASAREGLAVGVAAERLESHMTLWLFVQNFTCTYLYDGRFLRPRQCQISPI